MSVCVCVLHIVAYKYWFDSFWIHALRSCRHVNWIKMMFCFDFFRFFHSLLVPTVCRCCFSFDSFSFRSIWNKFPHHLHSWDCVNYKERPKHGSRNISNVLNTNFKFSCCFFLNSENWISRGDILCKIFNNCSLIFLLFSESMLFCKSINFIREGERESDGVRTMYIHFDDSVFASVNAKQNRQQQIFVREFEINSATNINCWHTIAEFTQPSFTRIKRNLDNKLAH